MTREKHEKHGH